MALHGVNDKNQDPNVPNSASTGKPVHGVNTFGGGIVRTFNLRPLSVSIAKHLEMFKAILNEVEITPEKNGFDLIPMDVKETGGHLGIIALARREQDVTAVVPLLIGGTVGQLTDQVMVPRYDPVTQQQIAGSYSIPQTLSDLGNKEVVRKSIIAKVNEHPAFKGSAISSLGPIAIPNDPSIPENGEVMYYLLARAFDAAEYYLQSCGVWASGSLSVKDLSANERLRTRIQYPLNDKLDVFGRPYRADIQIDVVRQIKDGREQILSSPITTLNGYMDAIYAGMQPLPHATQWSVNDVKTFLPAFVITNLDVGTEEQTSFTMSHVALAIASVAGLAIDNSWISGFRNTKQRSYRNLGALGKEIPKPGTPINADGSYVAFGEVNDVDTNATQFCRTVFYTDNALVVMLDIPESAPTSPCLRILLEAAAGGTGARDLIIRDWDVFTNNQFSRLWREAGSPALFRNLDLRLPMGTVEIDRGVVTDTRIIDQITIDSSEDDATVISTNNMNYYMIDLPGEQRTESIVRYQRARFVPEYYDYARRIEITPMAVTLLLRAIEAAGQFIEFEPNPETSGRGDIRTNSNFTGISVNGFGNGARMVSYGNGYTGGHWSPQTTGWSGINRQNK